ncbi:hypothetical protein BGX27_007115, partial [Mortierella sp. AM989]
LSTLVLIERKSTSLCIKKMSNLWKHIICAICRNQRAARRLTMTLWFSIKTVEVDTRPMLAMPISSWHHRGFSKSIQMLPFKFVRMQQPLKRPRTWRLMRKKIV